MKNLMQLPYFVGSAGPTGIHGAGNYVLKIYSPDALVGGPFFYGTLSYWGCVFQIKNAYPNVVYARFRRLRYGNLDPFWTHRTQLWLSARGMRSLMFSIIIFTQPLDSNTMVLIRIRCESAIFSCSEASFHIVPINVQTKSSPSFAHLNRTVRKTWKKYGSDKLLFLTVRKNDWLSRMH